MSCLRIFSLLLLACAVGCSSGSVPKEDTGKGKGESPQDGSPNGAELPVDPRDNGFEQTRPDEYRMIRPQQVCREPFGQSDQFKQFRYLKIGTVNLRQQQWDWSFLAEISASDGSLRFFEPVSRTEKVDVYKEKDGKQATIEIEKDSYSMKLKENGVFKAEMPCRFESVNQIRPATPDWRAWEISFKLITQDRFCEKIESGWLVYEFFLRWDDQIAGQVNYPNRAAEGGFENKFWEWEAGDGVLRIKDKEGQLQQEFTRVEFVRGQNDRDYKLNLSRADGSEIRLQPCPSK